jgi:DNA replication licensing factor MCM2
VPERDRRKTEKMPQDLLRKYIMYAREMVNPKLTDIDREKIVRFYTQIREESSMTGGLSIATRHLESIIRMAEGK